MKNMSDEILKTLKKYNQEHLINAYERLDDIKKEKFINQIETTDFELINTLYNNKQY